MSDSIQTIITEYISHHHMIPPGATVVAGVSGGADSMCLLLVLSELRQTLPFELIAVHVNHQLRGSEADRDEAFVREYCRRRQIPFQAIHADVNALAQERRISTEEAGRAARREAFERLADQYEGSRIALAHHRDDNAETVLLNLCRGSRLKGLGGIRPVSGRYIHPLLCVSREEIERYLEEKETAYCIDATNLEDTYTRNRIRRTILPALQEQVNPRAAEHIAAAAGQLQQVQDYLERRMEEAYAACVEEGETLCLLAEPFERQDPLLQDMVLHHLLERAAGRARDIGEVHVRLLGELLSRQTGRVLHLPYGLCARRTYTGLSLAPEEGPRGGQEAEAAAEETALEQTLELPRKPGGSSTVSTGKYTVICRVFPKPEGKEKIPKKTYTKWFDYDIIKQNLTIRTRRPGDEIVIDRAGSRQKLKSYFINTKLPASDRDHVLLVAEGSQIVWIVGRRQSMAYQVTERTRTILEITVR